MIDEADEWTFYREAERKAAKDHACCECDRTIVKGERYHYATGLMFDRWDTFRTCGQCAAARHWLSAVCGGWMYHAVRMELADHWGEDYLYRSLSFGRLVVWSGRSWKRADGTRVPVEQVKAWVTDALQRIPAHGRAA
jgi:hypothetical protein